MSVTRWPWADHLTRAEQIEIRLLDAKVEILQRGRMGVFARLSKIDALRRKRERIQKRGSARAKLEHKRGGRKPRGYRRTGT